MKGASVRSKLMPLGPCTISWHLTLLKKRPCGEFESCVCKIIVHPLEGLTNARPRTHSFSGLLASACGILCRV
eukprot:7080070-Prymnesium_polylepis.1